MYRRGGIHRLPQQRTLLIHCESTPASLDCLSLQFTLLLLLPLSKSFSELHSRKEQTVLDIGHSCLHTIIRHLSDSITLQLYLLVDSTV